MRSILLSLLILFSVQVFPQAEIVGGEDCDISVLIYILAYMDKFRIIVMPQHFKNNSSFLDQIITIPFESFVLDPWPFINQIKNLIKSKITRKTKKVIKKQNVPRERISDGIPLEIYKRCGWEPPEKNLSEIEELQKRRQFAIDNDVSNQALDILDQLIKDYEKEYFNFNEIS